jgi:AraC-like DNA-binding protein/quercetin dioxygenase-like cupin family protein
MMSRGMDIKANLTPVAQLSWLSEVQESGPRLTQRAPIGVRRFVVRAGPALPHPECHPYFELGMHLEGRGVEFVEREEAVRREGDVFVAGPGVPHWFRVTRYPLVGIAVYFLPSVLFELGPERDGLDLLRRFTSRQNLRRRLVRPPANIRARFVQSFARLHEEFSRKSFGSEIRLRTILSEMLIELVRWEMRAGRDTAGDDAQDSPLKWQHVNRALHYLREHFAEPVYARDVAEAVGVSESRLKVLFRDALGVPWSRYIQGYRIQQAVAMLGSADHNVTEAALAVGFESLSHFNATFRAFMGVAPSTYLKRRQSKTANV